MVAVAAEGIVAIEVDGRDVRFVAYTKGAYVVGDCATNIEMPGYTGVAAIDLVKVEWWWKLHKGLVGPAVSVAEVVKGVQSHI